MMEYDNGIVIHNTENNPADEFDFVTNIQVRRLVDGGVEFIISYRREGHDDLSMGHTCSKEEAEKIACGILGIHPGFVDLAKRSLETAEE
jgi:hypothetical protein